MGNTGETATGKTPLRASEIRARSDRVRQGWDRLLDGTREFLDDLLDLDVAAERWMLEERIEPADAVRKGAGGMEEMFGRQEQFDADLESVLKALMDEVAAVDEKVSSLGRQKAGGKLKRLLSSSAADEARTEKLRSLRLDTAVAAAVDSASALGEPLDLVMLKLTGAFREWNSMVKAIPGRVQGLATRVEDARRALKSLERRRDRLAAGEPPGEDETIESIENEIRSTLGMIHGYDDVKQYGSEMAPALGSHADRFTLSVAALAAVKSRALEAVARFDGGVGSAGKLLSIAVDKEGGKAAPVAPGFDASFDPRTGDARDLESRLRAATDAMRRSIDRGRELERGLRKLLSTPAPE